MAIKFGIFRPIDARRPPQSTQLQVSAAILQQIDKESPIYYRAVDVAGRGIYDASGK